MKILKRPSGAKVIEEYFPIEWEQTSVRSSNKNLIQYKDMVLVPTNSGVMYSYDGETWTLGSGVSNTRFLMCSDDIAVAVGSSGIYYSLDGKKWTKAVSCNSLDCISKTPVGGKFFVSDSSAKKLYTGDGINWQSADYANYVHYAYYYKNVWVISDNNNSKGIFYSTDCLTWNSTNVTAGSCYFSENNGKLYAHSAVGEWETEDGINWVTATVKCPNGIKYKGKYFKVLNSKYHYSTDLENWVLIDIPIVPSWCIISDNYLLCGTFQGEVYITDDGVNWITTGVTGGLYDCIYFNNMHLIATYSKGIYLSKPQATAEDVLSGKTAYVNGVKLEGTHVCPAGGLQVASGTFSKSSASKSQYIDGLPFTPKYFFCYAEVTNPEGSGLRAIHADIENQTCRYIIGMVSYAGGFAVGSGNYLLVGENDIEIFCQSTHLNPDMGTYHWIALG